jgi:glycosyltransferase involved in cell wall biosynthesis
MPDEVISYLHSLSLTDYIIIGIIALIWLFRFLYDIFLYGRLSIRKAAPAGTSSLPVTVMIVERNEEQRLQTNLPAWLQMGYPNYEVLVVDDFSEDNSLATLALLRRKYPRLKFTALNQETRYSEKLSRNLGLKAASHEMIVMSHPAILLPDNHWLPGISAAVSNGKDVVIGYCNLLPRKGFLHQLYRAESFIQQIDSMACSITGLPYVTAEENVTFRKSAYLETGGLAGKIREEYLNLEMVVNSIVKSGNVAVLPVGNLALRKDLEMDETMVRDLFSKSFRLKKYLKPGTRFFIGLSRITSLLLIPSFLLLAVSYPGLILWVIILIVLKSIVYLFIINRLLTRLHEPKLFVTSLLYGIIAPYYRTIAHWRFIQSRKKRKWGN